MEATPTPLAALLEKYDRPVPRYASYPAAPQFQDYLTPGQVDAWLYRLPPQQPVSLYVHLPFCASLCSFCGCNMRVTHSQTLMSNYLQALQAEVTMVRQRLPGKLPAAALHLGGGNPTYYSAAQLLALLSHLHESFTFLPEAEVSIAVDPRQMSIELAAALGAAGVTSAMLGVQDTNPEVQAAIGRNQSLSQTMAAFVALRAAGIHTIRADLLYDLPRQTEASLRQTAQDLSRLRPERIRVCGYEHLPSLNPHQKLLEEHPLSGNATRLELFQAVAAELQRYGYQPVGIDHFVLPGDPLLHAATQERLHRNIVGYTTVSSRTLLGFGVSAISTFPEGYSQNTTSVKDYLHQIRQKRLPSWKGLKHSNADRCAEEIIGQLLCHYKAEIAAITSAHQLAPEDLHIQMVNLEEMRHDGLVEGDTHSTLRITPRGQPFARLVAACFDKYLAPDFHPTSRL